MSIFAFHLNSRQNKLNCYNNCQSGKERRQIGKEGKEGKQAAQAAKHLKRQLPSQLASKSLNFQVKLNALKSPTP